MASLYQSRMASSRSLSLWAYLNFPSFQRHQQAVRTGQTTCPAHPYLAPLFFISPEAVYNGGAGSVETRGDFHQPTYGNPGCRRASPPQPDSMRLLFSSNGWAV